MAVGMLAGLRHVHSYTVRMLTMTRIYVTGVSSPEIIVSHVAGSCLLRLMVHAILVGKCMHTVTVSPGLCCITVQKQSMQECIPGQGQGRDEQ